MEIVIFVHLMEFYKDNNKITSLKHLACFIQVSECGQGSKRLFLELTGLHLEPIKVFQAATSQECCEDNES